MECRLCIIGSPFRCIFTFSLECKFVDTLISILKIREQDGLPEMICKDCLKELENIEEFLNKCEESDNILRSKIISDIKQEPKDIDCDDSYQTNPTDNQRKESNKLTNTKTRNLCEFIDVKTCFTERAENRIERDKSFRFISENIDTESTINKRKRTTNNGRYRHKKKSKKNYYIKPRQCPKCDETFINRGSYRYHKQKHAGDVYICDYCKQPYKHKASLIKHIQGYHTMEWEMHSCDICHKLFKHKHSLRVHFKNNHSEKKIVGKTKRDFTCVICNKKINNKESLKEHILQHINSEKNNCIQCNICSKIFTSNEDLTTHLTYHSDAKPFICRYCPKAFKNEDLRTTHEVTHTAGTPFKCPICQKGFVLKWNLKCHFRNTHKGMKLSEVIQEANVNRTQKECSENILVKQEVNAKILNENNDYSAVENFDDQKLLSNFLDNNLNASILDNNENVQDDSFFNDNDNITDIDFEEKYKKVSLKKVKNKKKTIKDSKDDLNTGVRVKRKYVKKVKEKSDGRLCSICGLYVIRKSYQAHYKTHLNTEKWFECDSCGKTFKLKASLKDHIQVHHMEVKMVPCRFCQKPFKHVDHTRKHEKLVHGEHEAHKCLACGKEFKTKIYLKVHMRIHTGIPRAFQCELCSKTFTYRHRMTRHMKVYHTDIRPYVCRFCPKDFKTLNHRGRHEMLHTGEVPHKCPVCLKAFSQKSNMKSHFVHNHKELDYNEMMEQFHKQQRAAQQNQAIL